MLASIDPDNGAPSDHDFQKIRVVFVKVLRFLETGKKAPKFSAEDPAAHCSGCGAGRVVVSSCDVRRFSFNKILDPPPHDRVIYRPPHELFCVS